MPNFNLKYNLPLFLSIMAVSLAIPMSVFVVMTQKQDTRSKAFIPEQTLSRLSVTEFGTVVQLNGVGKTPAQNKFAFTGSKVLGENTQPAEIKEAKMITCPAYLMMDNFCANGTINYETGVDQNNCRLPPTCVPTPPSQCPLDQNKNVVCPSYSPPADGFCASGTMVMQEKDICGCTQPPICKMPPITPTPQPPIYGLKTDDGRIYRLSESSYIPCSSEDERACPAMPTTLTDLSYYLGKTVLIEGVMFYQNRYLCDNKDTPGVTEECQTILDQQAAIPSQKPVIYPSPILSWWPLPNNISFAVNSIFLATKTETQTYEGVLSETKDKYVAENVYLLTPDNIVCIMAPCPRAPVRRPAYVRSSYEDLSIYLNNRITVKGNYYFVGENQDLFIDVKSVIPETTTITHTPTPTAAIPPIASPISWVTQTGSYIKTDSFQIEVNGKRFYGKPDEVRLLSMASDPGSENYTTIEITWVENKIPMRLYLYFKKQDSGFWKMYEVRTYDGSERGEWVYYNPTNQGKEIMHEPGQVYIQDKLILSSVANSSTVGKIYFSNVKIYPVLSNCHEGVQNYKFTNQCGSEPDGSIRYSKIEYSCFDGSYGNIQDTTCSTPTSTLLNNARGACAGRKACITPTPTPTVTSHKQTYIYISPDTINVNSGASFKLPILLSTYSAANKITAVNVEISFDPTKLKAVSVVSNNQNFSEILTEVVIDNTAGRITFARGVYPNPPVYGDGKLVAEIGFMAKNLSSDDKTQVFFTPNTKASALDASGNPIPGDVIAKAGAALVSIVKTVKVGDLNGNGTVDIYDYNIMLSNFGTKGPSGFTPADIDKDGDVDIFDYNFLIGNFGR